MESRSEVALAFVGVWKKTRRDRVPVAQGFWWGIERKHRRKKVPVARDFGRKGETQEGESNVSKSSQLETADCQQKQKQTRKPAITEMPATSGTPATALVTAAAKMPATGSGILVGVERRHRKQKVPVAGGYWWW
jgi:hypothetical protein